MRGCHFIGLVSRGKSISERRTLQFVNFLGLGRFFRADINWTGRSRESAELQEYRRTRALYNRDTCRCSIFSSDVNTKL